MHSVVFVILPCDTSDIIQKTEQLLAPYNSELELSPRREYFAQDQVETWAKEFGTDDLRELAIRLTQQFHFDAGVDERGLYELTTYNRNGTWDSWFPMKFFEPDADAVARWGKELARSIRPASQVTKKHIDAAHCLVAPDGKWHDLEDFGYKTALQFQKEGGGLHPANVGPIAKWTNFVCNMVVEHPEHLVFVLDCHS